MKKILILCMVSMLMGGLAFSQAQDPGFSNTVISGFGNAGTAFNATSLVRGDTDAKFHGFTNYFSANIDLGKLVIAGDIVWNVGYDGKFEAVFHNDNFNAIMQPLTGLDIGVGTNLEWKVGPAPTSGPDYSAYDVPYYAGLNETDGPLWGAGTVKNYFADTSLAVRYAFEDLIQVGFSLHAGKTYGLGVKANILDLFTVGFAYNGPFKKASGNSVYLGSTISAIPNLDLDVWWNIVPDWTDNGDEGNGTIGARIGFYSGAFYVAPEFSATFWNKKDYAPSMYIALDTYMSISTTMLAGLNASWGLGSDYDDDPNNITAGARLNINPYFIWNLNETNKLSVGAYLMPVWWQKKDSAGDKANFYWSIPIAWTVNF